MSFEDQRGRSLAEDMGILDPKKEEVSVKITGKTGTGKTRIAVLIAKVLAENGFDVDVEDKDGDFEHAKNSNLEKAVEAVRKKSRVKISTGYPTRGGMVNG